MDLYEKFADVRDRFEVLAFHDASVKSFEELDEKLAEKIEKRWGGRTLPFPILLDETGTTIKRYGISAYPTHVLIDPEGRVVKGATEKLLEEKLEALRQATVDAARPPEDGEAPSSE